MDASFELLEPIEEGGEEEEGEDQDAQSSRHSHSAGSSHRTTSTASISIHAVSDASTSDGVQEVDDEERHRELAGRKSASSGTSPLQALLNLEDGPSAPPHRGHPEAAPPTKAGAVVPPSSLSGIPAKNMPGHITFPSTERTSSRDRPLPAPPTSSSTPSHRASSSNSLLPAPTGEKTYDAILSAMRKSAEAAKVAAEKESKIAEEAARKARRAAMDAKEALVEAVHREGKRALAAVEKVGSAVVDQPDTIFTDQQDILICHQQAKTSAEQALARELAEQKKAEDAARAEIARLHVGTQWFSASSLWRASC